MDPRFDPGIDVRALSSPLGFSYGPGVFGPAPELRRLDSIRPSLRDPECAGPDPVYAIAMDIGREEHRDQLVAGMLLVGVVTYAAGRLGSEPVRSQGHVHRVSRHSGWSPPELYEIWSGRAYILMQEFAADDPGRCYAIEAGPGDKVVVPPGWAHATISADPAIPLTFGALCDREYGFEYAEVRRRGGLAWYPVVDHHDCIHWEENPVYQFRPLTVRGPRIPAALRVDPVVPLYRQLQSNFDAFAWVANPGLMNETWSQYEP